MKNIPFILMFLASVMTYGQKSTVQFGYLAQVQVGANFLTAPSRFNDFPSGGSEATFEAFQPITTGLTGAVIITPIRSDYISASYFNEVSAGMLYTSTHFYNYWGFRGNAGYKRVFLQMEWSARNLMVSSYTSSPQNATDVDESVHYSEYDNIRRMGIGLQILLSKKNSYLEFGYFNENYKGDLAVEPWSGAYFRWCNNRGIGLEAEISWDHPAYGYAFGSVTIPPDLPETGIYGQFKITYTLGMGDSYKKTFRQIKAMAR